MFELPQRFWDKVVKAGPDDCWEWQASVDQKGYGMFRFQGRVHRAHRLLLASMGNNMDGFESMHSCDNPPCCNPKHLSPGTQSQNQVDSVKKGRRAHLIGDNATSKKLDSQRVLLIRKEFAALEKTASGRYSSDGASKKLAAKNGITYENMMMIIRRKTWRHI